MEWIKFNILWYFRILQELSIANNPTYKNVIYVEIVMTSVRNQWMCIMYNVYN